MPSYTAKELERLTGFDRRTIAYYVQERLLPRVGRRGPRTRYPQLVRDRLLFIRRVREAEEAGEVPAVSLSDMRKVFERVPPALIARVASGRIAVTPDLVAEASTGFRLPAMRQARLEERLDSWQGVANVEVPFRGVRAQAPSDLHAEDEDWDEDRAGRRIETGQAQTAGEEDGGYSEEYDLADSLVDLQDVAHRRNLDSPRSMDTWTRIEISPDIVLSVRGIGEDDEVLVERVRQAMLRMISRRSGGADPEIGPAAGGGRARRSPLS